MKKKLNIDTESDVEQKIIWNLLTQSFPDGLGIPEECIHTKPNIKKFFTDKVASKKTFFPDYIVCVETIPIMVVEVKKGDDDLSEFEREARLYAQEINAQFPSGYNPCIFCITANKEKLELRKYDSSHISCTVNFDENFAVSKDMAEFCDLVKYDKLKERAIKLLSKKQPEQYYRALKMIGGTTARDDTIKNNAFGNELFSRFKSVFNPNNFVDRKKIVSEAYVPSKRRNQYNSEIDRVIRNSLPFKKEEITEISDSGNPKEVTDALKKGKDLKDNIMLLIGSVGSGKTTFTDYLQMVALPNVGLGNDIIWVRIDLNEAPLNKEEIYNWSREAIIEGIKNHFPEVDFDLLEIFEKIYKKQVSEFRKGEGRILEGNPQEFNKRYFEYISNLKKDSNLKLKNYEANFCSSRAKLLTIVLDNCDKRKSEDQLLMFQTAKWIKSQIPCLIILPLREETYELYHNEPPLDTALKDFKYKINPPSFQEVLKKRLSMIKASIKETNSKFHYSIANGNVEFSLEKIEIYLGRMMKSLFDHSLYGRNIVIGLAGKNIRKAFEIFLDFCKSGYLNEEEIFSIQAGGNSDISKSSIANMLFRNNYRYYDGDRSYVKNLFQCDFKIGQTDPFLRFRILEWFFKNKNEPGNIKGFLPLRLLIDDFSMLTTNQDNLLKEIIYLLKHNCLACEDFSTEKNITDLQRDVSEFIEKLFTLTASGHAHLKLAKNDIYYLAACIEDSWISDKDLAEKIVKRMKWHHTRALSKRTTALSAADFINYLKEESNNKFSFFEYEDTKIPAMDFTALDNKLQFLKDTASPKEYNAIGQTKVVRTRIK